MVQVPPAAIVVGHSDVWVKRPASLPPRLIPIALAPLPPFDNTKAFVDDESTATAPKSPDVSSSDTWYVKVDADRSPWLEAGGSEVTVPESVNVLGSTAVAGARSTSPAWGLNVMFSVHDPPAVRT